MSAYPARVSDGQGTTFEGDGKADDETPYVHIASWRVDMGFEDARGTTVDVQLIQLGTETAA